MELAERLERIAGLGRMAASSTDSGRLLDVIATTTRQVFACRSAVLLCVSEDSELLSVRAAAGLAESAMRGFRRPLGTGLIAEVMWTGRELLFGELGPDSPGINDLQIAERPTSLMCVRLEVDCRAVGCLVCESGNASCSRARHSLVT